MATVPVGSSYPVPLARLFSSYCASRLPADPKVKNRFLDLSKPLKPVVTIDGRLTEKDTYSKLFAWFRELVSPRHQSRPRQRQRHRQLQSEAARPPDPLSRRHRNRLPRRQETRLPPPPKTCPRLPPLILHPRRLSSSDILAILPLLVLAATGSSIAARIRALVFENLATRIHARAAVPAVPSDKDNDGISTAEVHIATIQHGFGPEPDALLGQ